MPALESRYRAGRTVEFKAVIAPAVLVRDDPEDAGLTKFA